MLTTVIVMVFVSFRLVSAAVDYTRWHPPGPDDGKLLDQKVFCKKIL